MPMSNTPPWPIGIISVVQTPFTLNNEIDFASLDRLIDDALDSGVDGFLVPALASEAPSLTFDEKIALARRVQEIAGARVPVFWGTGSFDPAACIEIAKIAREAGAAAYLVAMNRALLSTPEQLLPYFKRVHDEVNLPLMIQDWDPGGAGLSIETIKHLHENLKNFHYLKIETLPAGPKYTAVLKATNNDLHVSGGWAVPQMIEALDRGVHAMIPESTMIRIYKWIDSLYRTGRRDRARHWFNRLLPVLTFTNQELGFSIKFFKRLLERKRIFETTADRITSSGWDATSEATANELIDYVLELERDIRNA